MFDPFKVKENKDAKALKRKAHADIKAWVLQSLPVELEPEVETVVIQEFECGDPECNPVDTAIHIMFKAPHEPGSAKISKEMVRVELPDVQQAILSMLNANPPRRDPREDLSEEGRAVFEEMSMSLMRQLDTMKFEDKMTACQLLFDFVEQYEEKAILEQRRKMQQPDKNSVILSAAQKNDTERLQQLLESGIDVNYGNSMKQTALHVACLWGNPEAARMLLDNGADVHRTNNISGGTPLHVACGSPKELEGRLECVRMLIEAGADVSKTDKNGQTGLVISREMHEQVRKQISLSCDQSSQLAFPLSRNSCCCWNQQNHDGQDPDALVLAVLGVAIGHR